MFLCVYDEAVGCKVVLYVKAFVSVYLDLQMENIDVVDWCLVPSIRSNWLTDIEKLICKGKNDKTGISYITFCNNVLSLANDGF